ncbi:16S rRNA (uracil(1498)-N(3))-methyltransferase [Arachnia propionica]|uniref:Ribosomal RNA small subunit methyltransferase E n=1 Tax=Arachnia propionica TaxID=1750 RepID=A0A3P1TDI2_9ACTN|nr:16S rRNA (uracil(1498)-N(3))-methyltransferase [Arachnia propionica]MDO5081848.1 16S rRNA (uracil(1498)-N(3))-methyltransferase [Arachnia propionica]RRD07300.1 16S rRNA (uracil(1498)-N(3))-methyltransferase [Arachnia propionica]
MSDSLFLGDLGGAEVGDRVEITGDEARHAVAVKRTTVGERILISDGQGRAARGHVVLAERQRLVIEVTEIVTDPHRAHRIVVVQALAKGDRAELAVETMTELGVAEIIAWQAARSIVRWQGERATKSLARWAATAREATKQSRRLRVPEVGSATTGQVAARIAAADAALILHEEATTWLREIRLPAGGELLLVVGPEGGISPEELDLFTGAGGQPVLLSDGVLRTSTAGAAALAQLCALSP